MKAIDIAIAKTIEDIEASTNDNLRLIKEIEALEAVIIKLLEQLKEVD